MKQKFRGTLTVVFALLASAAPALAHHSFQAEFSVNKPVALTGTITKVEWINPHAQIYVDAKDASGNVQHWRIASWDPFALRHAGLFKNSFVIGQQIELTAYQAKDGSNVAYLRHLKLSGGGEFELWDSVSQEALAAKKSAGQQ